MIKSYSIVSVYVRKEHKPILEEMTTYAKSNNVSLNTLVWNCIENSWKNLKTKKASSPKS